MSDQEVEEIPASEVAVSKASTTKGGKTRQRRPNRFVEEWLKLFPGSTNANLADEQIFFDPYAKCRDATCPDTTGSELFYFFYYNKDKEIPI